MRLYRQYSNFIKVPEEQTCLIDRASLLCTTTKCTYILIYKHVLSNTVASGGVRLHAYTYTIRRIGLAFGSNGARREQYL